MGQTKIDIVRYKDPAGVAGWAGYIEPVGREWITYFDDEGRSLHFDERDPVTGAVIGEGLARYKGEGLDGLKTD